MGGTNNQTAMNLALIDQSLTGFLPDTEISAPLKSQSRAGAACATRAAGLSRVEQAQPEARARRLAPRYTSADRIERAFWWVCWPSVLGLILFSLLGT